MRIYESMHMYVLTSTSYMQKDVFWNENQYKIRKNPEEKSREVSNLIMVKLIHINTWIRHWRLVSVLESSGQVCIDILYSKINYVSLNDI